MADETFYEAGDWEEEVRDLTDEVERERKAVRMASKREKS